MNTDVKPSAVEQAKKTFEFWYKVFLETELFNDPNHRKEYQEALRTLEEIIKKN